MAQKMAKYKLPKGYSAFQTLLKTKAFLDNPVKFMAMSMEKFDGTYTATLGLNKKIIVTQNPAFIQHVLKDNHKNYKKSEFSTNKAVSLFGDGILFANGEFWLKNRRLIQPAFHKEKLTSLYEIIIKSIDVSLQNYPIGDAIDLYPIVHKTSFNILINSLFDIDLPKEILEELGIIFSDLQNFLIVDINKPLHRFTYPFTGVKSKALKQAVRIREIFSSIIKDRKFRTESFSDLLDMLLNSTYQETGLQMEEEQVIDELLILIFAGHETTANTLSWLLYLIANDNITKDKIIEIVKNTTAHDCLKNDFINATICEGMRLFPAAWSTERVAIEDDQFDGFAFPKGTIIVPFFFGLHRNKKHWQNESTFLPERFIQNPTIAKSNNFFPFGAGPRMCIGNNFAMAEMIFFLHAFFSKFILEATNQVPEFIPLITLRPDKIILNLKLK
jgi:cytochrome P450